MNRKKKHLRNTLKFISEKGKARKKTKPSACLKHPLGTEEYEVTVREKIWILKNVFKKFSFMIEKFTGKPEVFTQGKIGGFGEI